MYPRSTSAYPEVVSRLAEDLNTYQPLRSGDARILDERYAIFLGQHHGPHSTVVQRLRLGEAQVAPVVAEVRQLLRQRGRSAATWEVGPSARPASLAEQLQGEGLTPLPLVPLALGMALDHEPALRPHPRVRVAVVSTLEEFRSAKAIFWRAFDDEPPGSAAEVEAQLAREYESLQAAPASRHYLAWLDGEPVAAAAAVAVPEAGALLLCGGATAAEVRGRGVYQALLRARWQDAVAQRLPYLVTQAGPMSQPILHRAGFSVLARIRIFLDDMA